MSLSNTQNTLKYFLFAPTNYFSYYPYGLPELPTFVIADARQRLTNALVSIGSRQMVVWLRQRYGITIETNPSTTEETMNHNAANTILSEWKTCPRIFIAGEGCDGRRLIVVLEADFFLMPRPWRSVSPTGRHVCDLDPRSGLDHPRMWGRFK
jgi:hypothetical protein